VDVVPRRATPADLDTLLSLIAEFYVVDDHHYDRAHVVPALLPLLVDDALGQVWVLDEGPGRLTGYVMVTWSWSVESGGRDCILDELFVQHQGVGLGSRLVEHALREARAFGALAVFLETEAPNERARQFYARHGFAVEDSVWMSAPLS